MRFNSVFKFSVYSSASYCQKMHSYQTDLTQLNHKITKVCTQFSALLKTVLFCAAYETLA